MCLTDVYRRVLFVFLGGRGGGRHDDYTGMLGVWYLGVVSHLIEAMLYSIQFIDDCMSSLGEFPWGPHQ